MEKIEAEIEESTEGAPTSDISDVSDVSDVSEAPAEAEPLEEGNTQESVSSEKEEAVDWKARCERAEQTLDDAVAFGIQMAPYTAGEVSWQESGVYTRFCQLRAMGLSVKEAFSAANCQAETPLHGGAGTPSKKHLTSSVPKGISGGARLSGEELAIARELLGDAYSGEELTKLYRRVVQA